MPLPSLEGILFNMEKERLQQLKDMAWQTKSQSEWDGVMMEIKDAVEGDNYAATALRNYCKQILPKKKEWWQKTANRPSIVKNSYIFREDEGKAFIRLCDAIVEKISGHRGMFEK